MRPVISLSVHETALDSGIFERKWSKRTSPLHRPPTPFFSTPVCMLTGVVGPMVCSNDVFRHHCHGLPHLDANNGPELRWVSVCRCLTCRLALYYFVILSTLLVLACCSLVYQ